MSKTEDKLTPKQRAFGRALAMGDEHGRPMSISDCYRECYQTENMSDAVIRNEASKLASHRGITMMVNRLRRDNERNAQAQQVSDRERVLGKLRHWMDHGEAGDSNRIRSAELLGKSVGLFRDVVETSESRSSDELLAELEAMIEASADDQPDAEQSDDPDISAGPTIMH